MKIAFCGPSNHYTDELLRKLREGLPQDELLDWQPKTDPPARDLDMLIAIGPVSGQMIASQPKLTFIQTASDGYDAVDIDAATEAGIWVSYAPGDVSGNADSVAEYAVMMLIAANRQVGAALRFIQDHNQQRPMGTPALIGKTVCIYGFGDIGERVAERLKPFGVKLIGVNRNPSEIKNKDVQGYAVDHRQEALAQADAVVLCVRGSKENEHLVDAQFLGEMKGGATLVNIARGSLVDEKALLAVLKSGHIGAAGLDVQEHEPISPDDPLLKEVNVFVTPHIAGFTGHTLEGTAKYLVEVVAKVKSRQRPSSLLNKPDSPRLAFTR